MRRIEPGELFVRDLELAHPEGLVHADDGRRTLVVIASRVAHDEGTGGNAHKLELDAVPDFHAARDRSGRGLALHRGRRIQRPVGTRR